MSLALALVADVLAMAGLAIITIAVYGLWRMPDTYLRVHAASKAVFLGVGLLLIAVALNADNDTTVRALLLVVFFTLTTPVSTHAIARAAFLLHEPMATPGAFDESEQDVSAK